MTIVDPKIVCNNFLKRSFREGIEITPMKMQKLLYLLYARYLNVTNESIFSQRFEAWRYGPVLTDIYECFKSYGAKAIDEYVLIDNEKYEVNEETSKVFKEVIDLIWYKYNSKTGPELSYLTHLDGTAWHEAKKNGKLFLNDEHIKDDWVKVFEKN